MLDYGKLTAFITQISSVQVLIALIALVALVARTGAAARTSLKAQTTIARLKGIGSWCHLSEAGREYTFSYVCKDCLRLLTI